MGGMSILFFCPSGHLLSAAEHWQDRTVRCPGCGQAVVVPVRTEEASFEPPVGVVPLEIPAEDDGVPIDWQDDEFQAKSPPTLASSPVLSGNPTANAGLWMPEDTYRADRVWVQRTYGLAVGLAGIAMFSVIPALPYSNLRTAPGWACAALLIAALQLVYVGWMAATPDWLSVRVTMVVFAVAASLYAAVATMALVTPAAEPLPLALDGVRAFVVRWSSAVLLLMAPGIYLSGRVSTRWKRMLRPGAAGRSLRPGLDRGVTTA
jgi:hypothetical protein